MGLKTKTGRVIDASGRFMERPLVRLVSGLLIVGCVFFIGVNVGNGRIHLSSSRLADSSGLPAQLDYSTVNDVYNSLKSNYDGTLTAQQLTDGLKAGLANATGDPHTEFFTAKEAKSFNDQLNNSFSGIGAELSLDADKNLIVVSPISGFPAEKAGVKAQDIITTINGMTTTGLRLDEAISKIRGPKGTVVKLGLFRGASEALTISITRDDIKLPSVTTKTLGNNIGYIRISTFANDTGGLARQAADDFKAAGVKAIILDLRGDPGGLLDAAVDVSSLWVPGGQTVLQEKTGGVVTQTYRANGNDVLHGIPTVVLIDGGSASASEITAGALHDQKQATLLGIKSYGKGSVQSVVNFRDGSELKVTIARWYRPNGQNIDKKGITPDSVVQPDAADSIGGIDAQLQAAQAFLDK